MKKMSDDDARAFMAAGTRTAQLAVSREDGAPYVTPVWFLIEDDGTLVFTTMADTTKGRALRRDARVAICVDDDTYPYSKATVEGTAEIDEKPDPDELRDLTTRIAARYMPASGIERTGERNAVPGEMIVRVRPERLDGMRDVAA